MYLCVKCVWSQTFPSPRSFWMWLPCGNMGNMTIYIIWKIKKRFIMSENALWFIPPCHTVLINWLYEEWAISWGISYQHIERAISGNKIWVISPSTKWDTRQDIFDVVKKSCVHKNAVPLKNCMGLPTNSVPVMCGGKVNLVTVIKNKVQQKQRSHASLYCSSGSFVLEGAGSR